MAAAVMLRAASAQECASVYVHVLRLAILPILLSGCATPPDTPAPEPGSDPYHRFNYTGWLEGADVTILAHKSVPQENDALVLLTHDAVGAYVCPPSDPMHCVESMMITFAVPRDLPEDLNSWTHRSLEYQVLSRGLSRSILGNRVDGLMLITRPISNQGPLSGQGLLGQGQKYFLYSPERGLIGFGSAPTEDWCNWRAYWLTGPIGFGAASYGSVSAERKEAAPSALTAD